MNALSHEARALIDGVLTHDDPTQADKARVRERLCAELGTAAFATLALTAASAGGTALAASEAGTASLSASGKAAQSTSWSLLGKLALSGAALSLVGALWFGGDQAQQQRARPRRAAPEQASAPAPASLKGTTAAPRDEAQTNAQTSEAAAAAAAPAREDAPKSEGKRLASARKPGESEAPMPAPAAAPSTLGRELKMLAEAQAALRAGAPERALALAAQHRASFPDGVMKEERQGIEALAGCALGRDYRAQAEAFLRAAQSSPLAARVRKACGIEP